ncbi:MAG: peptide chain release factor N(5)-glutamine methyltransferase [Kiritimatiellae bacterium]|nr:peptide chain release factor N(5)-glutamine methyltransferase [Kiritimatiellia bacterium]MDD3519948.1 peptide chain release factor N(5)-glutamine methyltransferase [Actinomycetota bacterium]
MQKQIWTVNKLITWTIDYFKRKNINNPRLSAELLLSYILNFSRMELYLHYDFIPEDYQLKKYRELISKRLENIPIQYLTNESYFRKLKLFVDERVLIPRPETELLIDEAIEKIKELSLKKNKIKILEIGTGSGAISLSIITEIKKTCPGISLSVIATEKSPEAIEVAKKNARMILKEDYPDILRLINCDIIPENNSGFDNNFTSAFDIIISNPPYIREADFGSLPEEVRKYEPAEALIAGIKGTEVYLAILERVKDYINSEKAFIIFETDPLTCKELEEISKNIFPGSSDQIKNDYNNLERIFTLYII